jgi:hypothetical protein
MKNLVFRQVKKVNVKIVARRAKIGYTADRRSFFGDRLSLSRV